MKAPTEYEMELPRGSPRHDGRGVFLVGVAIFGAVLCVLIWQVPQPWRGYVIAAWMLMMIPGLLLLRFLHHWYHWREFKLWARMQGKDPDVKYTIGWQEPKQGGGADHLNLKVVVMEKTKGGRFKM